MRADQSVEEQDGMPTGISVFPDLQLSSTAEDQRVLEHASGTIDQGRLDAISDREVEDRRHRGPSRSFRLREPPEPVQPVDALPILLGLVSLQARRTFLAGIVGQLIPLLAIFIVRDPNPRESVIRSTSSDHRASRSWPGIRQRARPNRDRPARRPGRARRVARSSAGLRRHRT